MDCKRAQELVPHYLRQEVSVAELGDFVEHVKHCEDCYEELEIYYTIDAALKALDSGGDIQSLHVSMERALDESEAQLRGRRYLQIFRYIFNTLVFWAVVAAIVLQCRILLGFV